MHPADLDDAGCALATTGGSDGETRLPFALEIALLQRAPGVQWAVRHLARRTTSLLIALLSLPLSVCPPASIDCGSAHRRSLQCGKLFYEVRGAQ